MMDGAAVPEPEIVVGAHNVPVRNAAGPSTLESALGALRYSQKMDNGTPLDILALRQPSDVLVVALHGALDRTRFTIPRFEWLTTVRSTGFSYLGFADPSLHLTRKLELSWFTGSSKQDLIPVLQSWVLAAATSFGASKVVITGSSGGGFASLQLARVVPGAVACVFNPQTAINRYVVPRWGTRAQRRYLEVVMPELMPANPEDLDGPDDWTLPLGDRLSAVRAYSHGPGSKVIYNANLSDWHHETHYLPFVDAVEQAGNSQYLRRVEYDQGAGHPLPTRDHFIDGITAAAGWA